MKNPEIESISDAIYEQRKLVRIHAMRRTLWVLPLALAPIAHAATTRRYVTRERERLLSMLVDGTDIADPGSWLAESCDRVLELIAAEGPIDTRSIGNQLPELRHRIELAQGKRYATTTSALSRVLLQMGFEGRVVRGKPAGTWVSSQYRWESSEGFSGVVEKLDPAKARTELVQAWLGRFGPGTERDIAWWAGLPLGMVRQALQEIGAVEVELETGSGWVAPDDVESTEDPGPSVALLPGLDPSTMGWKERDWYLDSDHAALLFDRNGNGGPTVWVDGRIVGGWAQDADGRLVHRVLEDVGADTLTEIEEQAGCLESVWGDVRFSVRFPAPLQRELLAR